MVRLPYTLAQAVSTNSSGTVLLVADPGRYPPPQASTPWVGEVQAVLQYDTELQRPAAGGVDDYLLPPDQKKLIWYTSTPVSRAASDPAPTERQAAGVYVFLEGVQHLPTGPSAWYILRHQVYGLNGISGGTVQDLQVRNVTLWTVPGMGVVCEACTDVTIDRLQIKKRCDPTPAQLPADHVSDRRGRPEAAQGRRDMPRPEDADCTLRPMSITADGTHLTSCRGGNVHIVDSVYEGQGDDGINIPSRYWEMRIVSADGKSAQVWQRGSMNPFVGEVGDQLLFYNRSTFESYGLENRITLASPGPNPVPGWINFSAPLPVPAGKGNGTWDLVLDLENQPGTISLANTSFLRNRARGSLLKASNVDVNGCIFNQTSGPAIQVVPDAGVHWFEADVISRGNWTVRNSQVIECSYGAASNGADIYVAA